jgi:hypothetical protein
MFTITIHSFLAWPSHARRTQSCACCRVPLLVWTTLHCQEELNSVHCEYILTCAYISLSLRVACLQCSRLQHKPKAQIALTLTIGDGHVAHASVPPTQSQAQTRMYSMMTLGALMIGDGRGRDLETILAQQICHGFGRNQCLVAS